MPEDRSECCGKGLDRALKARDSDQARAQYHQLAEELEGKADIALATFEQGLDYVTAVLVLPERYRRRLWSTNALERLIEEGRRRERVTRILPSEESTWRLLGAFVAERRGLLYCNQAVSRG